MEEKRIRAIARQKRRNRRKRTNPRKTSRGQGSGHLSNLESATRSRSRIARINLKSGKRRGGAMGMANQSAVGKGHSSPSIKLKTYRATSGHAQGVAKNPPLGKDSVTYDNRTDIPTLQRRGRAWTATLYDTEKCPRNLFPAAGGRLLHPGSRDRVWPYARHAGERPGA